MNGLRAQSLDHGPRTVFPFLMTDDHWYGPASRKWGPKTRAKGPIWIIMVGVIGLGYTLKRTAVVAILDNAVDHRLYAPVEHWAQFLDVPWKAFSAKAGQLPDKDDGFTHIIISGSESSILDREAWVEAEAEFVREAVGRNLALLGSCWGHQLLAYALDGPSAVRRGREPEVGWISVDIPESCGLLGDRGSAFSFSLHFDEVTNASGRFKVLASTDVCRVQAMTLPGGRVWGLQVHPEIDIASGKTLLRALVGLNPRLDPLYESALRSRPRDSGLIHKIVKYFLDS
jgi:GMP synthase-like glutamine amidotransferase